MIRGFTCDGGRLRPVEDLAARFESIVWLDLVSPTPEEEADLEQRLGLDIPTREEMQEIEISSRLYQTDGAAYMTAILLAQADRDDPQVAPVTFLLAGRRLITVRYHEPRAFQTFPRQAENVAMGCEGGDGVLLALLEAIVDRLADILERAGADIDRLSRDVFQHHGTKPTKSRDFQRVLEELGRKGDLNSRVRDSLATLERLTGFFSQVTMHHKPGKDSRERIKTLFRDLRSLSDHAGFMSQKITFLLDATLGLINIEQNAIIKIFSVAAVVFLPPTLIASIYGMNFEHMPELSWLLGYPFALGLMVLSGLLPYLFFKRRGWL